MRFFTLLFSCYILFLSCSPCKDEIATVRSKTQEQIAENHHQPCNEHSDTCSPFCTCSCCGQSCNTNQVAALKIVLSEQSQESITAYRSPFVKDVLHTIWQPPKIG